jgi:hypothetical protein|uniref:Uncharacterized protein n=1 Tax=Siphoviridae sp. ctxrg1 TaxID=2825741 RepID=A0A8S5Q642_9CAUD|nr:MAG TPA: hypothetical protein [Siphoviridae sp. ctxrg1]DAM58806.1 MAG TPA: hypothetical protein [Caudoviricetes sp.]DAX68288.1 MAG TPA: hypothetical protein [Caudoviricetes sp.]
MTNYILQFILQLFTVAIIPLVKIWFDNSNKQIAEQFENLNKEVKKTQNQVEEVTQIGLHNRDSNKSIMSYRLHKEFSEAIERGYTTSEDLSELSGLYKSYAEIGGNGKIETLFNRFKTLPIQK